MKTSNQIVPFLIGLMAILSTPALATVNILSLVPSYRSPQPIGRSITWTAQATDSNTGPLTFQFSVTPPNGVLAMVKDFNVGTLSDGTWTAKPFVWVPTGTEGPYMIRVVAKDFASGEITSRTVTFQVSAVATSSPRVERTANPLVALFSAPSCAAGSLMRAAFQQQNGSGQSSATNWLGCHPPATMTFEIAGMYPSTAYNIFAQLKTGNKITNGPMVPFTTGALPTDIVFPTYSAQTAATDASFPVILHNSISFGTAMTYPDTATDLAGNIIWYYSANDISHGEAIMRPVPGGGLIVIQDDYAWDPSQSHEQYLRQIDLAGNLVRETNMGAIQQQLLDRGAVNGGPCSAIPSPRPVGAGCAGAFHHDAIQTLPNGWIAVLLDIEKIFPPGTQGDTSGKPVDIIGDMIVVLDTNWQLQWYWDSFNPAGGGLGYSKLPVLNTTAVLAGTCGSNTPGCPPMFLLGNDVAPLAHDWLHANSLYYWPAPQNGNITGGDLVWSSRHQDWVFRIDYRDGAGTGNILWRMGPTHIGTGMTGDFTFLNIYNDPWPWFSGQHDVGMENGGTGPMTVFDNGNTRLAPPPLGLGVGCTPYDCHSRGMALTVNESTMQVTPVVNLDLGSFSTAMGSAQLLANGNYFFENAIVVNLLAGSTVSYSIELAPTPAAPQAGPAHVLANVTGPQHYRGWQLSSLYVVPTT